MSDQMLFEQNADDITTAYTDYGLQVTINVKLSRDREKRFCRAMLGVFGVKACQIDQEVTDISENTTFIVTFQDRPGIVHKLIDIRAQITEQARQYVQFAQTIPTQQSLF